MLQQLLLKPQLRYGVLGNHRRPSVASLTARFDRNLLRVEVPCDSLQLHREVHLEGGGQLRLFMQTEACCGEAPEVALSILGHWALLEGAHLLGS